MGQRGKIAVCSLLIALPVVFSGCQGTAISKYWGNHGETWVASGPLTDYSHAGLGENGFIPDRNPNMEIAATFTPPPAADDLTVPVQAAIDALASDVVSQNAGLAADKRKLGVLNLSAGILRFKGYLNLSHSNLVLRGAGQGHTTLSFERPKAELDCEDLRVKLNCLWFQDKTACEPLRAALDCKWYESPSGCAAGLSPLDCRWSQIQAFFQKLNSSLQCPVPPAAPLGSAACTFAQNLLNTAPLVPKSIVAHASVPGCKVLTRRTGDPSSVYGYGGGLIVAYGSNAGVALGTLDQPVLRGDTRLHYARASTTAPAIHAGDRIRIVADSPADGSLARELYAMTGNETVPDNIIGAAGLETIDFSTKVVSADNSWLEIERPLRVDLKPGAWNPRVVEDKPTLENIGIENVSVVFPYRDYPGHHYERGFNAIQFNRVAGCWGRNIDIVNMEDGIILGRTRNCTFENVTQSFALPANQTLGLMALSNEEQQSCFNTHEPYIFGDRTQDNLLVHFAFGTGVRAIHGVTLSRLATGNVVTQGQSAAGDAGGNIALDHHGRAPFDNLFVELEVGDGKRVWMCGGDSTDHPESGRYEVFWNLSSTNFILPPTWARQAVIAGINTTAAAPVYTAAYSLEGQSANEITPQNIYKAQLGRRICGGTSMPAGAEFDALCVEYGRQPSSEAGVWTRVLRWFRAQFSPRH